MPEEVSAGSGTFDIDVVAELFENSLVGDSDVSLSPYVDAFRQLNKFFSLLGKGFSFVEKDLLEKMKILGDLQAADSTQYDTINNMVSWELLQAELSMSNSGSRTLLRLHRALLFVTDFLKNLKDSHKGDQISTICQSSYDHTLSRHHSWIMRKLVSAATHLLVSRDCMLSAITNGKDLRNKHEAQKAITRFVGSAERVYGRVQQIYESKNITDLP